MIDWTLIWDSLPALIDGALISLQIAGVAAFIGVCWGTILSLGETSDIKIIKFCVTVYITLFRGTPMLVQILFVFYVLPQFGVLVHPFWAATLAIGLNSGAYVSQVIRSGINGVSGGQIEAAYTLGLSKIVVMLHIVLPQAFRKAMPSLGNEMITLVKDSSLASVIGVMELTKQGSIIRSRTYDAFSILLAVSIFYLLITGVISLCIKKLEEKINKNA